MCAEGGFLRVWASLLQAACSTPALAARCRTCAALRRPGRDPQQRCTARGWAPRAPRRAALCTGSDQINCRTCVHMESSTG